MGLDLFKLDGKVALVTGCKRGIGKAMAIALAEAGADIVGVSAPPYIRCDGQNRFIRRSPRHVNG